MQSQHPGQVTSQEQFGRQARYYVDSVVHREGESLQLVEEFAARRRYRYATDIGTGVGFTAFAVAGYAEEMVATDITDAMLQEARQIGAQRGLSNVRYALAAAEQLPFADGALDLVVSRTAAHHFRDIPQAVAEWRRVLAPDGVLILADTVAPEDPEIARWMHDIEIRRDPSHVWEPAPSRWLALLDTADFDITDSAITPVNLEFDDWARRSGTPASEVQRLRQDFLSASPDIVAAFDIRRADDDDIHFRWDCLVVRAVSKG
jgi:SAM-dependent methyltransferase